MAPYTHLHGERDGCQMPSIARRAADLLTPPSRFEVAPGAGHLLRLERPEDVNERIAAFGEPA